MRQTLTDLNDFITPSQACIKPVEQVNKPEPQDAGAAAVRLNYHSFAHTSSNLIDGRPKSKSIRPGLTSKFPSQEFEQEVDASKR